MILSNLFESIQLDKDPRVQQVIEKAFETINLVKNASQTTRVEQVVQLLTYMNGLIVVGPPGSGKSTVLKLYQEYLRLDGCTVKEIRMNPKSLTKHEF